MTETIPAAAAAEHGQELIEGPGRYRVYQTPDGGWLVARAGPVCDRCEQCGCGDQGDPIVLPPMVIALGRQMMQGQGGMKSLLGALRAARRG